ncbi:MAG TPA: SGNH/GDSL hydrolase family protein [Opitutaceae bacterium]|nr:SGNH/GDSL hydrolase family protein [Opitutaceae bacterium]
MRLKSTIVGMFVASAVTCAACASDSATPAKPVALFPDGASVASGAKIESADFPAEPLKFYRFECRMRSPGKGFVAALWRNPDATWGRDLQGRPGDLRAEDYQLVQQSDDWHTVVFYSRAQANAVAGCLRVQALDESMEIESASVTGPASAVEVLAWSESLLDGANIPTSVGTGALPRTVAALRSGGTLRIAFLGDSIMQDAANSPVDLWLESERSGLRAEIITAIGGGAGMERWSHPDKFPGHDLNLRAAVIDGRPDLVLIGGISTRSIDDTRAIIGRIRDGARAIDAPEPDIALLTGPFGEWAKPAPGIDAAALGALASETGCAFLDLRAAWIEAIAASGREPATFYRDAIHGSATGKHLQGRIIADWILSSLNASR